MPSCVLAADIGTTSLKCAFIDFEGKLLVENLSVYGLRGKPVSAYNWENAFYQAVRGLTAKNEGIELKAICISGNGPSLVPVSFQGEALEPLHWHNAKVPAASKERPSLFLPHVCLFMETRPSDYENISFFLSSNDWLCWRLGADTVASFPSPEYRPYYWDEDQCAAFGIDKNKFPSQVTMGNLTGKLSADAAAQLGIKPGIPIVSGAPDFISAIIGAGVLKTGMVCNRAGSSEGINICIKERINAEGFRVLPHAMQGLWNLGAVIPQSGLLLEAFREETETDYGKLMEELIPELPPSKVYNGEIRQPTTDMSRVERGRLILQTIAFSVRAVLDKLGGIGFTVEEMIVSGGQAKNRLWNQLKADMTGTNLLIPEIADAELAGNAVLAALALGEVSSLEEGAARMIRIKEKFSPVKENVLFWKERYHHSKGG